VLKVAKTNDDPVDGYPKTYARDAIPEIKFYPGGQTDGKGVAVRCDAMRRGA
jgi:hypothetical protein